jgi:hypothetical protein
MSPRHPVAPIPRRSSKQDHDTSRKLVNPLIEPLRSLYAGISSPWQSRLSSPRVTVRNTSPAILHPVQFLTSFFVTHGTSSPSSTSHRRSCSPREIHFPPILLHNQGYPKVCSDSLNLPNAGDPFAGTSSLSSYALFSPTRDLIALI